jgi:hypothetical protein
MYTLMLAFGILIGIILCGFIYATEYVLQRKQHSITKKLEEKLKRHILPRIPATKGAIFMPESDEELARKEIIARNDAAGKSTKLEDL